MEAPESAPCIAAATPPSATDDVIGFSFCFSPRRFYACASAVGQCLDELYLYHKFTQMADETTQTTQITLQMVAVEWICISALSPQIITSLFITWSAHLAQNEIVRTLYYFYERKPTLGFQQCSPHLFATFASILVTLHHFRASSAPNPVSIYNCTFLLC